MVKRRPLGLTILGGLFTFIGGLTSFIIFIEVVDSIRFFGFGSILIDSPAALAGFILYGGSPVLLYFTGIGIFTASAWSRKAVIYYFPIITFFLFFNIACHFAREYSSLYGVMAFELIYYRFDIFVNVFLRYLFLMGPILFYFNQSVVVVYFEEK